MPKGMKCPKGHAPVWAKGYVPTLAGVRQRFICTVCGTTFYKPKSKPVPEKPKEKKKGRR